MPRRRLGDESRKAAEEYFRQWVEGGEQRLAAFGRRVAHGRGPTDALGYRAETLPALFGWVVEQCQLVDEVPDVDLPEWYLPGPSNDPEGGFDPEGAWLVDGLARYWAELLVRTLPGLAWQIADEPRRRMVFVDQNWPVLEGPLITINPQVVVGKAEMQAALPVEERDPELLLQMYRRHERYLRDQVQPDEKPDFDVGEIDVDELLIGGWRWEVGLHEEVAHEHEDELDELTSRLGAVPGVKDIDHQDRESWLVAGSPEQRDLERAVRAWLAEQR